MIGVVTRDERERLRALVDQAARTRLRSDERLGVCGSCGVAWSQRTRGCVACQARHWHRRNRARNGHVAIVSTCSGCGRPWSDGLQTPGCKACYRRALRRRERESVS
jgi:hypothetical protein